MRPFRQPSGITPFIACVRGSGVRLFGERVGVFDGPIEGDVWSVLSAPLALAAGDAAAFVGFASVRHLGRTRSCGLHVALHRDGEGGCWTHLYRVLAERGGGRTVLLCRALPGDGRATLAAGAAEWR